MDNIKAFLQDFIRFVSMFRILMYSVWFLFNVFIDTKTWIIFKSCGKKVNVANKMIRKDYVNIVDNLFKDHDIFIL